MHIHDLAYTFYIYIHTYIHVYIYTCIYIHMQICCATVPPCTATSPICQVFRRAFISYVAIKPTIANGLGSFAGERAERERQRERERPGFGALRWCQPLMVERGYNPRCRAGWVPSLGSGIYRPGFSGANAQGFEGAETGEHLYDKVAALHLP